MSAMGRKRTVLNGALVQVPSRLTAAWIVIQWMTAVLAGTQGMMLATPAHIGGFLAGLVLQRPLLLWRYRRA